MNKSEIRNRLAVLGVIIIGQGILAIKMLPEMKEDRRTKLDRVHYASLTTLWVVSEVYLSLCFASGVVMYQHAD